MAKKRIDKIVLEALVLMSKDEFKGVNYLEFVKRDIMMGALNLIDKGYATRINIAEDNNNYILTSKGIEYLDKITRYASRIF